MDQNVKCVHDRCDQIKFFGFFALAWAITMCGGCAINAFYIHVFRLNLHMNDFSLLLSPFFSFDNNFLYRSCLCGPAPHIVIADVLKLLILHNLICHNRIPIRCIRMKWNVLNINCSK